MEYNQISPNCYNILSPIPRDQNGIQCVACNTGYAKSVDCTKEECSKYGCGRDSPGMECCSAAFICLNCNARLVGTRESPEYYD